MNTIYYSKYCSSIGKVFIGYLEDNIFKTSFDNLKEDDFIWEIMLIGSKHNIFNVRKRELSPYVKDELDSYFDGKYLNFSSKIKFLTGTNFQKSVWEEIRKIPYGTVAFYSDIAMKINAKDAVRAVGNAIGANPIPIIIPCHRVIRKNTNIGGFGLGIKMKIKLLKLEGITINKNNTVNI